jgi:hypothetical protein
MAGRNDWSGPRVAPPRGRASTITSGGWRSAPDGLGGGHAAPARGSWRAPAERPRCTYRPPRRLSCKRCRMVRRGRAGSRKKTPFAKAPPVRPAEHCKSTIRRRRTTATSRLPSATCRGLANHQADDPPRPIGDAADLRTLQARVFCGVCRTRATLSDSSCSSPLPRSHSRASGAVRSSQPARTGIKGAAAYCSCRRPQAPRTATKAVGKPSSRSWPGVERPASRKA